MSQSIHRMVLWNIKCQRNYNLDNKRTMNVFLGTDSGVQVNPFKAAWTRCNVSKENWIIQYITVQYVNEKGWTEKQLVDWLLESNVHFILSHVHQGVADYLLWNMVELETQLNRLKFHPGFPNLDGLKCPVFLQNKYDYLRNMPMYKVNNTLQIYLTDDKSYYSAENGEFINRLKRYIFMYIYIQYICKFFLFALIYKVIFNKNANLLYQQ
jgi:hypothetical protein